MSSYDPKQIIIDIIPGQMYGWCIHIPLPEDSVVFTVVSLTAEIAVETALERLYVDKPQFACNHDYPEIVGVFPIKQPKPKPTIATNHLPLGPNCPSEDQSCATCPEQDCPKQTGDSVQPR